MHPTATCEWDRIIQHPVICLTPGLFGWSARSAPPTQWPLTKTTHAPPTQWTFAGSEPLGYLDGRVLMGLTAAIHPTRPDWSWVGGAPKSDLGRAIRQALVCEARQGFYAAPISLSGLAREAGYTPSPHLSRQFRASLDRLQAVTLTVTAPTGTTQPTHRGDPHDRLSSSAAHCLEPVDQRPPRL